MTRSIRLNAREVNAAIAGTLGQVRRIVAPQIPEHAKWGGWWSDNPGAAFWWMDKEHGPHTDRRCPFGAPGDTMWVAEALHGPGAIRYSADNRLVMACNECGTASCDCPTVIMADTKWPYQSKSVGAGTMAKCFSRLTLRTVNVRAERVREISEADAKAMGAPIDNEPCDHPRQSCVDVGCMGQTHRSGFWHIWQKEHPGSWERNDWVWVGDVEVVK